MSFAFKEWRVVVEALGSGEQILILRKGGIAEKTGEFQIEAGRFWLFPTEFHAQREKTKLAAARWLLSSPAAIPTGSAASPAFDTTITLLYFAEIVHHAFLDNWPEVAALDPHHFWAESAVREKFDWSEPPGLHALVVRVHRLHEPLTVPVTPEMGGCKSWIEIPYSTYEYASAPVLDGRSFDLRRRSTGL